jgi:hypothetical protein
MHLQPHQAQQHQVGAGYAFHGHSGQSVAVSDRRPDPTKWELLAYPAALVVVPIAMLFAVTAREDLRQPLAGIIVGLAIFSLAGGFWLSWRWWKRFGHRA